MASIVAKMFFSSKKTILLIFVECVLCEFLSYENDQVVKTHLIYQEKMRAVTFAQKFSTYRRKIAEKYSPMGVQRKIYNLKVVFPYRGTE